MKRTIGPVLATLLALTLVLSSCATTVNPQKTLKPGSIQHLPSYSAIVALLKQAGRTGPYYMRDLAGAPEAALDSKSGNDFSTTNIQVAGVDEADIVKTDGSYLYLLANGRFLIVDIREPSAMKVVAEIKFASETSNEYPMEMFLDIENRRATVITNSYRALPQPTGAAEDQPGSVEPATKDAMIRPGIWWNYGMNTTAVRVYDVSVPSDPALVRIFEQDGSYLSSRRIGSAVYLITNRYSWYDEKATIDSMIPSVRNGGTGEFAPIGPSAIGIVKSNDYSSFLVVSGVDTVDPDQKADTKALLGAGNILYASTGYLYVAVQRWEQQEVTPIPVTEGPKPTEPEVTPETRPTGSETNPEPTPFYDKTDSYPNETGDAKIVDYYKDGVVVRREIYWPDRMEVYVLDPDGKLVLDESQSQTYPSPETPPIEPDATPGTDPAQGTDSPNGTDNAGTNPDGSKTDTKAPDAATSSDTKEIFVVMPMPVVETFTDIFRFRIADGTVTEDGVGVVPGYILNQFSMDEHDGYLRIATTVGDAWRNDQYTSMNNLYVLDGDLKVVGKVEGMASRETIKSVRFIGDKAYLVTFRTTDPLFVLDLASPTAPKILGELKIPGYSEYLHPYDDGLLIGFGKDAIAIGDMAYYLGMKFSMFDVRDPADPKEVAKLSIGDRGTNSEISYNHKALLFSKDKNVIGIPIMIHRVPKSAASDPIAYGQPIWQGFLILGYDAEKGLYVRGMVTNSNKNLDFTQDFESYEDINAKADPESMWGPRTVTRGVYVGNVLYTISGGLIKASSLDDFSALGTVEVPGFGEYYGGRVYAIE